MNDDIHQKLNLFCKDRFGSAGKLSAVNRLSGGASMESWSFQYGDKEYVMRRLPSGISSDDEGLRGISLATQADVIELAVKAGVTAPLVTARMTPDDGLGEGFIMSKAQGETLPHKILGNPEFTIAEGNLTKQCARELALIHKMDANSIKEKLEYFSPTQLIELQKAKYDEIGGAIAIYEYAIRWLLDNVPKDVDRRLVHGDFRMGNLMIDHDGISAVLDWELARLGDPVQDLAYLCTPSWRFGRYAKVAGGFDSAENLLAAYATETGEEVDPARFRFWLIYSTVWWGVACLVMGEIWRTKGDRSLERTVIGRRVSEVEIDLALLFEELLPAEMSSPLDWQMPHQPDVTGETSYGEVTTALSEWNTNVVQPDLSGHHKFQSRVAGNALGIIQRRLDWGMEYRIESEKRLAAIGYDHRQLCDGLAKGSVEMTAAIWDHLRLSALERLSIDQPKYAGLNVALKKWSTK